MPKRKEPELKPEEQWRRFQETARQHGVDETGKEFEEAFKRLSPSKQEAFRPDQDEKPIS